MKMRSSKQLMLSQELLSTPYSAAQELWKNLGTLLSAKEEEQERLFFAFFTAEQDTKPEYK